MCKTKQTRYTCKHLGAHICVRPCSAGFHYPTAYCNAKKNKRLGYYEHTRRCEVCRRKNRPRTHSRHESVERRPKWAGEDTGDRPVSSMKDAIECRPTLTTRESICPGHASRIKDDIERHPITEDIYRRSALRPREESWKMPSPHPLKGSTSRGRSSGRARSRSVGYGKHHSTGYGSERSTAYSSRAQVGPKSRPERKSGKNDSSCAIM